MEIILLKDVDKVGEQYEIVKVKDGYGRNYLIPQGFAVVANDSNRRKYASIVRAVEKKELARLGEYKAVADKVSGQTVTIKVKAGSSGKLFGSVDAAAIAEAANAAFGTALTRKQVVVEAIKEVGTHTATVVLHKEVSAQMNVEIVAEEGAEA